MCYIYIMNQKPKYYVGMITTKNKDIVDKCGTVQVDDKEYNILYKRAVGHDSYIFEVKEC